MTFHKAAATLTGLILAGMTGCWGNVPKVPPTPTPAPAVTPIVKPVPPVVAPPEVKERPATETPVKIEPTPKVEAVTTGAPPPEPAVPVSKERIVLMAPLNPFIIEFHLTIDGQPHVDALERLVDEVIKLADSDGDGRPSWKEVTSGKRFKYGQFGNLAINSDNDHKQIVERYDIDRDTVVDRSELPRFLTRNAGGSRSFSIRGTADYREINRRGAPAWRAIDSDGDGAISAAEREAAAGLLKIRDNDDDEILVASDLNPRMALGDPSMMTERRRRGPEAARLLGPHADWDNLRLALEHDYAGSENLHEESFPLTPRLFTQLDANKDGRVDRTEIKGLSEVPPHVVIAVDFGKAKEPEAKEPATASQESEPAEGTEDSGQKTEEQPMPPQPPQPQIPRLKLVHVAEELSGSGQSVVEQPNRLTLSLGGMTLTIFTNDTVASDDFEARANQALMMFDANKNGYVEKEEVPEGVQAQFGQFEAVDADEDGKAFAGEIAAYLSQQQAALRAQIHARASDREDALFAVLDTNHDERLDSREQEAAAERLASLDRDGDGLVSPEDIPEAMVIGLARGSLENIDALFTPPPVIVRSPTEDAPRWFTAMDANSDGAISQREFLGSPEKFAEMDADKNGLLELAEAVPAPAPSETAPE
jgi:Ca2+-binding EF-hand superfamily protein